jgi:AcrR family transcriptional regulator
MPRSREQLEVVRDESRRRIVETALRLFAERGYASTSVRMIAAEAGISQGLLYNYFDGKEALLRAIFERGMSDVGESFERAERGASPEVRIERLVRAAFEIVADHLPFWRLTYQLRLQPGVMSGLAAEVRAWSEAIRARLEPLLRATGAPRPESEARLLFAAIDGVAQHYAMDPDGYPIDEVAGVLVRKFVSASVA